MKKIHARGNIYEQLNICIILKKQYKEYLKEKQQTLVRKQRSKQN